MYIPLLLWGVCAAGATGGALHGPGAATLAGAGLPGAAHTPGSFTHRASLGIGGGLAEGEL